MDYVEIVLPLPLTAAFTYGVPDKYLSDQYVGKRALVNFNGRKIIGYIVGNGKPSSAFTIKPIEKLIDDEPLFTQKMIAFAEWISAYYFASVGEALSLMVPKGVRPKESGYKGEGQKIEKNELTESQQTVYQSIRSDLTTGRGRKFYLYGITGSGKTEIYFKLIEDTLDQGKQVIFLVPEIAMSYQTLDRLRRRFGDKCAVLHSGLTGSVKLGEYLRLLRGEAVIAVGPRSALFAPFDNIGLIIIDEEHEGAYKSDESPRFHARSAAIYLSNVHNALLVLGSATPSIESWYHATHGFFILYRLQERYGGAQLPDVRIIDTSQLPPYKYLTAEMTAEINRRLQNHEQVILLQNRRGFANCIQCEACKTIIVCPKCSIALTYHKSKGKLLCHRCGYSSAVPEKCPECGHERLSKLGAGTQKIEAEIAKTFPHARVLRIDYDALHSSSVIAETFAEIERGEIDIIVGTQMIAKGLHFPGVKFVGVVNADLFLNIPDFKAAERAFSLITQVAGRAGRTGEKGLVMIQTMNPDHYSITTSTTGDFDEFYENEITFREMMGMPPFRRLLRLVVRGTQEETVKNGIAGIKRSIDRVAAESVEILGPSPCMITKINMNYRYQIVMKSVRIEPLQKLVKAVLPEVTLSRGLYLEIDTDPADLF